MLTWENMIALRMQRQGLSEHVEKKNTKNSIGIFRRG